MEREPVFAQAAAIVDKAQVADYLGVSVRTVDRLREAGEIDSVKVGRRSVRITVTSVARYIERQLGARAAVEAEAEAATQDPFAIPLLEDLKAEAARRRARKLEAAA